MAVRAETQIDLTRVDNGTPGSDGTMLYATCTTAAATAAKVGTLSPAVVGFTLQTGCMVVVNFSNTNSSSSATFDLNSTGAYGIRYKGAALTSTTRGYLAANRLVILQFDGTYWEITGATTDSNNYDRTAYKAALTATGPISAGRIGVINASGNIILLSTTPFDMTGPIVYIGTAYTSDALTQTNNYTMYGTAFNLANTVSGFTGTAGAAVFIKGTISGKMFTPDAGVLTTTVPSTADGKIYMLLGTMSTTTNGVLAADHPCYAFSSGAFKLMPGEQGPQGIQGPAGPTGPAGPGITYVTLQNGDDMNSCIAKDTVYVTSQTAVCNSLLNMPTGFPAGELRLEIEWLGSNDYIIQHLYCKNGAIRKTYLRTYSNGTFGAWTEEGVIYGTSSTAAATAAKTATVDNYELDSKQYFAIKFTNENTASNPTLSVNGGTAKAIYTNGVNAAYWAAGATVNFYYDGTYYQVASAPVYASTVTVGNPNGDNVFIGNSGVEVKDGSDTRASFLNDGMRLYDQNSSSDPIASFTTNGAIIGTSSGNQSYYVKINQGELDFYYGPSKRAYLEFFEGTHLNIYSYFPLKINGKVLFDFVTSEGKTGSWYYQKWASGKIEAWSDSISSGTLSMSSSYRLYRSSNTEFTIADGIFDSTPTNAYVTIPYSSGAAIVNALVTCYSKTKLRCQIWKDANDNTTRQAAVNLKFYVVYFPSTY